MVFSMWTTESTAVKGVCGKLILLFKYIKMHAIGIGVPLFTMCSDIQP